jgi:hypothetical protein
MGASSDLISAADDLASVSVAKDRHGLEWQHVEDEEFPAYLPASYDWMLPPASSGMSRRRLGILLVVAALLIAVSFFVFRG